MHIRIGTIDFGFDMNTKQRGQSGGGWEYGKDNFVNSAGIT